MAPPKRKKAERERDLIEIERMYVQGMSQREIAQELGKNREYTLSHKTVGRDIHDILDRWRETIVSEIDEMQAAELARLNRLEREVWQEWLRSKKQKERTLAENKTGGKEPGQRAQIIRETMLGDPRYLQIVQACIRQRCEILGLKAPEKREVSGKDGEPLVYRIVLPSDLEGDEEL